MSHPPPPAVHPSWIWQPDPDHPALRRLFAVHRVERPPDLAIHGGDDMMRYVLEEACGAPELAAFFYFRSALMARDRINQTVAWWRRVHDVAPRILDFGSGFGRVSRFLAADHGVECLTAAEVVAPAVEFQRRHLGLHAVLSTSAPEDLRLTGSFDVIAAMSLFSHLPPTTFPRWLARLAAQLTPRGALLLSTHRSRRADSPEIEFEPHSESSFLSGEEYGTSWIQERYFRRVLAESCGTQFRAAHFPKALWNLQDVWAVTADDRLDLESLSLRRGPIGFLEFGGLDLRDGVIRLSGWAVADDGPARVGVEFGEGAVALDTGLERPDAAQFLGAPDARLGWSASGPPPPWGSSSLISITAADGDATFLVHAATVDETVLWIRARAAIAGERQLEREVAAQGRRLELSERSVEEERAHRDSLAETIRVMRMSRFWKARDAWWALKARIRGDARSNG